MYLWNVNERGFVVHQSDVEDLTEGCWETQVVSLIRMELSPSSNHALINVRLASSAWPNRAETASSEAARRAS